MILYDKMDEGHDRGQDDGREKCGVDAGKTDGAERGDGSGCDDGKRYDNEN